MSKPNDDGLLSRWSRRKRAADEQETTPPPPEEQPTEPDAEPDADLSELSEAEVLEQLGLPDPDTMKDGDDFKPFLQASVPAALRKRALRTLWASNPVLANVDGLVEYGEDFTDAAMVPEVLNTIYQVGKGMLKDIQEIEDVDGDSELAGDMIAELDETPEVDELPDSQPDHDISEPDQIKDELQAIGDQDISSSDRPAPVLRRMRFET